MGPVTDYQILQRDKRGYAEACLAGKLPGQAEPGAKVYMRAVRQEDGLEIVPWTACQMDGDAWQGKISLPQGGLYRLEACALAEGNPIEWAPRILNVRHVGVGELFLLAGQSNMAGYGREPAFDPPQLGVHLYGNNGRWSLAVHPLNDSIDTIYPENAEYPSASSPALAFGRMLSNKLGLPVGLVQASLGGSPLREWHPAESGALYRAMIRRLEATGKVGGVLWYQGCSDTNEEDAPRYFERFAHMLSLWREVLGEVPILTVQLNKVSDARTLEEDRAWGMVREAQRRAARELSGVSIISTTDFAQTDGIHNGSAANVAMGERMAHVLLKDVYGMPGLSAPDVAWVRQEGPSQIRVGFSEGDDVVSTDPSAPGMDIEDELGICPCAKAEMQGAEMVLTLPRPIQGKAVFHALWRCLPPAYAPRSRYGMPMLSCYGVEVR